jgi:superfamily II DNA helicase RecQ
MLPAYMEERLTNVVVPFVALLEDLRRRLGDSDIAYSVWRNNEQAIGPNVRILLVLVDLVASTDFLVLCKRLAHLGRSSRIDIDEAHLAVSSATYSKTMSRLYLLRTISEARLLFLSATVPPQMERQLQDCFSTVHRDQSALLPC